MNLIFVSRYDLFKIIVVILLIILVIIVLERHNVKNYFKNINNSDLVINTYNDYVYLLATNPNFILSYEQYKNVITDIFNNNPEIMNFVIPYDIYRRSGSLIDISTFKNYQTIVANNLDNNLLLTKNEYNSIITDASKNNNIDPNIFNDYDTYFNTGILTLSF